jgi:hypothetical protein
MSPAPTLVAVSSIAGPTADNLEVRARFVCDADATLIEHSAAETGWKIRRASCVDIQRHAIVVAMQKIEPVMLL